MAKWKIGERIPANQLADITQAYQPGAPFGDTTLPLYHHAGIYDATTEFLELFCASLGISPNFEGGNFVICLGPNNGINGFRA